MRKNGIKDWLKIRSNQVGVFFVIAHWLFFGFTIGLLELSNKTVGDKDGLLAVVSSSFALLVIICDSPAIIISLFIWSPLYILNDYTGASAGVVITSFFTINYQWIIVGRGIFKMFSPIESKMVVLSILED